MNFNICVRRAHLSRRVIIIAAASILCLVVDVRIPSVRLSDQEGVMKDDKTIIDEARARRIAQEDARQVYRDLSVYLVSTELKGGKWYVDYDLEGERAVGGGPHYVISATTGEILERRYEQ